VSGPRGPDPRPTDARNPTDARRPTDAGPAGRRHTPARVMTRTGDQRGSLAVLQAAWLFVLVVLVGLVVLDVGALLRAARVTAAAADGAALAAASATRAASPTTPRVAAARIARAHDATLTACDCHTDRPTVTVTRPVTTRLLVHLGVTEVRASATARLVPRPSTEPPGRSPSTRLPEHARAGPAGQRRHRRPPHQPRQALQPHRRADGPLAASAA
jgi:secretion/DNA translocation related TadE-like protein